jgi:molybdenum cofactor guanylyltransferase
VKRLGAIIAGGKAARFGGDKASAMLNGRSLIDHVVEGLRKQVDHLIVVGREWPGLETVSDLPCADLGPLGGINAALQYAQKNGFDEVVTAGCDVLPVPEFKHERLDCQAIYVDGHYLFGIWSVELAPILEKHLSGQTNLSMRNWIAAIDAHPIEIANIFQNLNTPSDLAQFAAQNSTFGLR